MKVRYANESYVSRTTEDFRVERLERRYYELEARFLRLIEHLNLVETYHPSQTIIEKRKGN